MLLWKLYVEAEVDHVAVLHDIVLTLTAELPFFLGGVDAAVLHHVIVGDYLGTDETALNVGVDLTGCLRRLGTLADGPCTALVLTVGQEGDETQQGIGALDEAVQTGLGDANSSRNIWRSSPSSSAMSCSILAQMGSTCAPSASASVFTC